MIGKEAMQDTWSAATGDPSPETARLGMWVFLATEVLFLGAAIASFVVYRSWYARGFTLASRLTHLGYGTLNTGLLLTSSLGAALAGHTLRRGRRGAAAAWLAGTGTLGVAFLAMKAIEYAAEIHEGLMPGAGFRYVGPQAREVELFYYFYFVLTGLHALHMLIGVGLLWGLAARLRWQPRADLTPATEMIGLYWHFVDIVWVFLFPLIYLEGRHG